MGVSFKVSKTGKRFRPKPQLQPEAASVDGLSEKSRASIASKNEFSTREPENNLTVACKKVSGSLPLAENEVSFTLNLFSDGYSIAKPLENDNANQSTYQDVSKLLHPYDRTSESLFSAIESGHLPGDILDYIPCKYVDGALVCEVCDYRSCSEKGSGVTSTDVSPIVSRIRLRMSLENVVKEIPSMTDGSWTYGDLMEVESRILKVLEPQLHLDPTPKLDRLCVNPVPTKISLSLSSLRRKRLRQMPEITVTASNKIHGKKVCVDRVPETSTSRFGDSGTTSVSSTAQAAQHTHENLATQNLSPNNAMALRPKSFASDASLSGLSMISHQPRYPMGIGIPRSLPEQGSASAINASEASSAAQDIMIPYVDNANSNASLHAKRENQDGRTSPMSNLAKRTRPASAGLDGTRQQQIGLHVDGLQGADMTWQNAFLHPQAMSRGLQYASMGNHKISPQAFEGGLNQDAGAVQFAAGQQSMRFTPKKEQFEMEKLDGSENSQMETNRLDPQQSRLLQRLPQHAIVTSNIPQSAWNNLGQGMEIEAKREEQLQKRKAVQSPRLSGGAMPQSPLSSKSGEISSGSVLPSFGPASAAGALGASQRDKTTISAVPTAVGTPPLTNSANDSTQRQHQPQIAAKRRSNSLPKTSAMSGVGSPASVSNVGLPLANSPSVGNPSLGDHSMVDRFSKIQTVTMKHQLNCKKNKTDNNTIRKQSSYSPQLVAASLSSLSNEEDSKDDAGAKPLSKSLVGGSMNVCKLRVSNFMLLERVVQGNVVSMIPKVRTRMIMSEKPSDGTVAMLYGEIDDGDFLAAEDYLPTLPNAMKSDGYVVEDNHVQPRPNRVNLPSGGQLSGAGMPPRNPVAEMQQYGEPIPGQLSNDTAKPASASLNASQSLVAKMLPPGNNPQALQMSQGLLSGVSVGSRPPQLDPQQSVQQQQPNQHSLIQQPNPQFQRSPTMLGTNPLSHLNAIGQNPNMQLGNQMANKQPSSLQMQQMLHPQQPQQPPPQQQQQQQQQPQMQRKMMMGLGPVGMSNMRSNVVGLGGLGSPMGMGAARGIGAGISAPMGSISGMGNMGQNPVNLSQASNISNTISQQFRSGTMTPSQAEMFASKLRMAAQNRASMFNPQSSLTGISGARQMHPGSSGLSMLNQSLNRANMGSLQRAIGPMGPPKLMAGMNLYMSPQQQQQLQLQQQHQLQQQQQQLQQQLQQQSQQPQETSSQLQAVVSPSQVGSPSASSLGVPPMNQQMQHQQASPQQMNQRTPMSPQQMSQRTPLSPQQMSSGAIHALSAGNPEACPASPQLSVGSITNSPMDMQGVNKSGSANNA